MSGTVTPALLEQAAHKLKRAQRILVVTGAGISAESGIPTFRGSGGLWEGFRAEDLATPAAFKRMPGRVWKWYRWRRQIVLAAQPNPGHLALATLEKQLPFVEIVTQNVDGLHGRAGSQRLIELHGNIHRARCTDCHQVSSLPEADVAEGEQLPECWKCGGLLRPHILWFGEHYWPGTMDVAMEAGVQASVILVVGTSAQVYAPVGLVLEAQELGAFVIDVNPEETHFSRQADIFLQGTSGTLLPQLSTFLLSLEEPQV